MDKIKPILAGMKKHHFWILCVVVVLAAGATWWMASSALSKDYLANKSKIDATANSLKTISSDAPNATFQEEVDKLEKKQKEEILETWNKLYAEQQPLFEWPQMVSSIEQLKPTDEISSDLREVYRNNVIENEWNRLLYEVGNVRRPVGETATARRDEGTGRAAAVEYEGIVGWEPGRINSLVSRYLEPGIPSSQRVRVIQEDLWVFNSLLKTIAEINREATDQFNAPIREIQSLDIAQYAVNDAQAESISILGLGASGGGGGGAAIPGMGKTDAASMMGGGGRSSGKAQSAKRADGTDPNLDGRYLDAKGEPLAAKDPPPAAEFRQMFVRMKVVMLQERIPELIASCANAELPIETRRLLVVTDPELAEKSMAAGGGGMMGMGGASQGMSGMMQQQGGNKMMGNMGGDEEGDEGGPNDQDQKLAKAKENDLRPGDAVVELCGVICLFNPPDPAKLGTGNAASLAQRPRGIPTSSVATPTTGSSGSSTPGMGGGSPGG